MSGLRLPTVVHTPGWLPDWTRAVVHLYICTSVQLYICTPYRCTYSCRYTCTHVQVNMCTFLYSVQYTCISIHDTYTLVSSTQPPKGGIKGISNSKINYNRYTPPSQPIIERSVAFPETLDRVTALFPPGPDECYDDAKFLDPQFPRHRLLCASPATIAH